MKHVFATALALSLPASLGFAQEDHLILVGFADSFGPKGPNKRSYPVARVKDNNLDGLIDAGTELHAFLTKSYSQYRNGSFMTDASWTVEDGRYAFYFTDSGDGRVVRGVDANHNGVLDQGEVSLFYSFSSRFAPDSLAVWRDTTKKQTIVYVALDEKPKGIHRLVDLNGDGDALDAGEHKLFVHAGLNLTVPGKTGPVKLVSDAWKRLRMTPRGTLIAYNGGRHVSSVPQNPDMYAFYAIRDNNGTPTVSVWLNTSRINGLKTWPDFAKGGKFPQFDIATGGAGSHALWNDVSLLAIDPRGAFPGFDAYYFSATYAKGTTGRGDVNPQGVKVSGLIYRVVDRNFNERVDAGEVELFANLSNAKVAGVAPFTYKNRADGSTTINLDNNSGVEVHDLGAAAGAAYLYWENGGNDCVVKMVDKNRNGVIETGEATQPWFTPGGAGSFPFPFSSQYGPFTQGAAALSGGRLPGPFPVGLSPYGTGCATPAGKLRPVVDAFGGIPKAGNSKLSVALLRGVPGERAILLVGLTKTNRSLGSINMPGCTLYTDPVFVGDPVQIDPAGQVRTPLPLPANPWLIGKKIRVQWAVTDMSAQGVLPVFASNALEITVQK